MKSLLLLPAVLSASASKPRQGGVQLIISQMTGIKSTLNPGDECSGKLIAHISAKLRENSVDESNKFLNEWGQPEKGSCNIDNLNEIQPVYLSRDDANDLGYAFLRRASVVSQINLGGKGGGRNTKPVNPETISKMATALLNYLPEKFHDAAAVSLPAWTIPESKELPEGSNRDARNLYKENRRFSKYCDAEQVIDMPFAEVWGVFYQDRNRQNFLLPFAYFLKTLALCTTPAEEINIGSIGIPEFQAKYNWHLSHDDTASLGESSGDEHTHIGGSHIDPGPLQSIPTVKMSVADFEKEHLEDLRQVGVGVTSCKKAIIEEKKSLHTAVDGLFSSDWFILNSAEQIAASKINMEKNFFLSVGTGRKLSEANKKCADEWARAEGELNQMTKEEKERAMMVFGMLEAFEDSRTAIVKEAVIEKPKRTEEIFGELNTDYLGYKDKILGSGLPQAAKDKALAGLEVMFKQSEDIVRSRLTHKRQDSGELGLSHIDGHVQIPNEEHGKSGKELDAEQSIVEELGKQNAVLRQNGEDTAFDPMDVHALMETLTREMRVAKKTVELWNSMGAVGSLAAEASARIIYISALSDLASLIVSHSAVIAGELSDVKHMLTITTAALEGR